jgi:diguanylate cyclase (GGDEF)-like protein/PAS domain S-box-containing protein
LATWLLRPRWNQKVSSLQQLLDDEHLFANIPVALSLSDREDHLLKANAAFEKLTGFAASEMLGQNALCTDSEEEKLAAERMQTELQTEGRWVGEYRMRCKDGSVQAEKVMRVVLGEDPGDPEGYLTMSMDTVHSDAEQRLMLWQAHHDNLTKLPNANLLNERLTRATQENKRGAVISIDLDHFKHVNDSLGHAGADRILIDAAFRIAMAARESDTVARTAGDLFVIALTDFGDIAEVEKIARNAVEAIAGPFKVVEDELFITASAGVSIYPDDGKTPGELLQKSDAARLNAKSRGGNQVAFFEDQMNAVALRRFELETHLRKAIAGQEFELYFQPVIDISRDEIYGAEALLRWKNPELGMVSPAEFIPVAEDTGLIVDIGRWVVAEVHRNLRQWQDHIPGLRVSLNVSARQLADADHVQELLDMLGREYRSQVTVELTETALVQDEQGAQMFLKGLREMDLHVALDDFGTGYSSVGYLRDYEFDVLKVDKSFIDGINGARDLGLVASIVAMGRILGMRVVAEGVEEEEQVQRLKRIGCDFIQGYYYSKPLPALEFAEFVASYRADPPMAAEPDLGTQGHSAG